MSIGVSVETERPSYFLISVSTRENLDLCARYALAGFPSGENGAWTFCEIQIGDFVSFLYGAKAYNLYKVTDRQAFREAESLPPWPLLTFRETGRTYSFPFRLSLQLIREFTESLIRQEFSYVGENLLLRGGYRKTHFQADQTTLQTVSQIGTRAEASPEKLLLPSHSTFILRFTRNPKLVKTPETFRFMEPILQSAIRRHLTEATNAGNLQSFLSDVKLPVQSSDELEVLGEKALPQGHIDLLLKPRVPLGTAPKIPLEVKTSKAQPDDLLQLREYMAELRGDCPLGVLIAADFAKRVLDEAPNLGIRLVRYTLKADLQQTPTFEEIYQGLNLEALEN
jgi:hypothetical protein